VLLGALPLLPDPEPLAVVPPARTTFQVKWWPPNSSLKPLPVALPAESSENV
jgi:hypothetical protein